VSKGIHRLVVGWVLYLLFVLASTEILSFFNLISRQFILAIYGVLLLSLLIYSIKSIKLINIKKINLTYKKLSLIFLILLPLLFIVFYYPPNNWDSMTYHMARVMHWVENKNVDHYLTQTDRQLYSSPLAEYVLLHLYLIANSDVLTKLVQYVSFIVCAATIFLITDLLSKNEPAKKLAVVLALTLPIAIMQSTSTQNDLVAASVLLTTLYLGLKKNWWLFGISLGLGVLVKNTFSIFILPFCIYFAIEILKEYKFRGMLIGIYFIACLLIINYHQGLRNYNYFGSIFGPKSSSELILNQSHEVKLIISNIVRNIGNQIGLPINSYNLFINNNIYRFHDIIGVNILDTKNTFLSYPYTTQFSIHEDYSGNFILMILILFSLVAWFFINKPFKFYWICIVSGWVLFNYFLKWQPWSTRLVLPWFMVLIPFVSIVLSSVFGRFKYLLSVVSLILVVCSLPFVAGSSYYFGNFPVLIDSNRQLLPLPEYGRFDRLKRYFYQRRRLYLPYVITSSIINRNNINTVALDITNDSWEYPWWVYLRRYNQNLKIKIVDLNTPDVFYKNNKYELIISNQEDCQFNLLRRLVYYDSTGICVFREVKD
jgi:hypothetical protein